MRATGLPAPLISPALLPLLPTEPIPSPIHGRSPVPSPASTPGTNTPIRSHSSSSGSTAAAASAAAKWFLHPRPLRVHLDHPPRLPLPLPAPTGRSLTPPVPTSDAPSAAGPRQAQRKSRAEPGPLKMLGEWRLGESLGRGTSGAVRLARHTASGEYGAVKIVPKRKAGERECVSVVEREIGMLKVARHPYLIALAEVFETDAHL